MATRQRSRASRTPPPVISGSQLSDDADSPSATQRVQESEVLRSSFDPQPYQGTEAATPAPQVTFVGEQIIYKDRDARIAEAAYLRAEQRGFEPGYELSDWLAAEREIDALLASSESPDGNLDAR